MRTFGKYPESGFHAAFVFRQPGIEERLVLGMGDDLGEGDLREHGGADLQHLGDEDDADIVAEILVLFRVVDFEPPAPSARPRDFLTDPLHRYARNVADYVAEPGDFGAVEDEVLVDLVEYQEAMVFLGDRHHAFQILSREHDPGRIVGVDHEDPRDIVVVADLVFELVEIDPSALIEEERIGDRVSSAVHRLRGRVRRVGRVRADHADMGREIGEYLADRLPEPVEEYNVFHRADLLLGGILEDEFARTEISLGRGIRVRAVAVAGVLHHFFHPVGNFLALRHRVADILPDHGDAPFLDLLRDRDNLANLVSEVFFSFLDQVFSHVVEG